MTEFKSDILHIQYDILKAIDSKSYLTDKDLFQLENSYQETRFLTSLNSLISNYVIESLPIAHNQSEDDIDGAELQYTMTDKGRDLLKNLYAKHAA